MKTLFPVMIKWVASVGESLHRWLSKKIRTVVKSKGGVTYPALDKISLVKSEVYEALRIKPPVSFQYGKAKVDTVVHSHNAAFKIKEGEIDPLGYQPFATKDGRVCKNWSSLWGIGFKDP